MPQYYVDFYLDGNISGFYVDEIHGDAIPESAVPITIEEWQTYSTDARLYKRDGDMIRLKTPEELDEEAANQPPAPKTPEQERIEALEAENATLWYEIMLKEARISEHDTEIADLWYEIMTGGGAA
ncbi:hypothetical protein PACILC2_22920 [Paenibacillus cisolokensis]|uniref:Tail fiber assembly protein n=1 Tax=Paenibacillus cisolokensis TaxID=1658519 RepID=A0ABQ4N6F1_9BACL|nr:hypothetical protein [Paenibacillus cisolokensis]GIQ63724.1 hypothetical protein PACILC2_22920 [Paenibacillus cisolokensis]